MYQETKVGYISDDFFEMIPDGERFELFGQFSKAAYLRGESGCLLLLFEERFGLIPFGIAVSNFQDLPIGEPRAIFLKQNQLMFLKDGEETLEIRLQRRQVKKAGDADCAALRARGTAALRASEKGVLKSVVLKDEKRTPFSETLTRCLAVVETCQQREALEESVREVIGLGPGLTPSCDDFFVGYLYAKRRCMKRQEMLEDCIKKAASVQTTACSAAYLKSACEGRSMTVIEDLFTAGDSAQLDRALALLLEVGSSSGADILTGILAGLR